MTREDLGGGLGATGDHRSMRSKTDLLRLRGGGGGGGRGGGRGGGGGGGGCPGLVTFCDCKGPSARRRD